MRGSSVNFKKVTSALHSVSHSSREVPPDYLLQADMSGGAHVALDDSGEVQKTLTHKMNLASRQAKASKDYSPLWEGVINLPTPSQDVTAKEQIEIVNEWCFQYEKMTGHKVLRADVHLDEGYIDADGRPQFNAHAHVICDRTTEQGKVIKLSPAQLRGVQNMTADVSKLTRGIDARQTGRKHINHQNFKFLAEKNRVGLDAEKQKRGQEERATDSLNLTLRESRTKLKESQKQASLVPQLESDLATAAQQIAHLQEQYRLVRAALKESGEAKQADYQSLKKEHEAALATIKSQSFVIENLVKNEAALRGQVAALTKAPGAAVADQQTQTPAAAPRDALVGVGEGDDAQTRLSAFLELHKHVKKAELSLIEGARLDACSGRVGLFSWLNRVTGGRNEVLCELPYSAVMPKIGERFDKNAGWSRGRGGR